MADEEEENRRHLENLFEVMKTWSKNKMRVWLEDTIGGDESTRPFIDDIFSRDDMSHEELVDFFRNYMMQGGDGEEAGNEQEEVEVKPVVIKQERGVTPKKTEAKGTKQPQAHSSKKPPPPPPSSSSSSSSSSSDESDRPAPAKKKLPPAAAKKVRSSSSSSSSSSDESDRPAPTKKKLPPAATKKVRPSYSSSSSSSSSGGTIDLSRAKKRPASPPAPKKPKGKEVKATSSKVKKKRFISSSSDDSDSDDFQAKRRKEDKTDKYSRDKPSKPSGREKQQKVANKSQPDNRYRPTHQPPDKSGGGVGEKSDKGKSDKPQSNSLTKDKKPATSEKEKTREKSDKSHSDLIKDKSYNKHSKPDKVVSEKDKSEKAKTEKSHKGERDEKTDKSSREKERSLKSERHDKPEKDKAHKSERDREKTEKEKQIKPVYDDEKTDKGKQLKPEHSKEKEKHDKLVHEKERTDKEKEDKIERSKEQVDKEKTDKKKDEESGKGTKDTGVEKTDKLDQDEVKKDEAPKQQIDIIVIDDDSPRKTQTDKPDVEKNKTDKGSQERPKVDVVDLSDDKPINGPDNATTSADKPEEVTLESKKPNGEDREQEGADKAGGEKGKTVVLESEPEKPKETLEANKENLKQKEDKEEIPILSETVAMKPVVVVDLDKTIELSKPQREKQKLERSNSTEDKVYREVNLFESLDKEREEIEKSREKEKHDIIKDKVDKYADPHKVKTEKRENAHLDDKAKQPHHLGPTVLRAGAPIHVDPDFARYRKKFKLKRATVVLYNIRHQKSASWRDGDKVHRRKVAEERRRRRAERKLDEKKEKYSERGTRILPFEKRPENAELYRKKGEIVREKPKLETQTEKQKRLMELHRKESREKEKKIKAVNSEFKIPKQHNHRNVIQDHHINSQTPLAPAAKLSKLHFDKKRFHPTKENEGTWGLTPEEERALNQKKAEAKIPKARSLRNDIEELFPDDDGGGFQLDDDNDVGGGAADGNTVDLDHDKEHEDTKDAASYRVSDVGPPPQEDVEVNHLALGAQKVVCQYATSKDMPLPPEESEKPDLATLIITKCAKWWKLNDEEPFYHKSPSIPEDDEENFYTMLKYSELDHSDEHSSFGNVSNPDGQDPDEDLQDNEVSTTTRDPDIVDEFCGHALLTAKYRVKLKRETWGDIEDKECFQLIFTVRRGLNYFKSNFQAKCNLCDELILNKRHLGSHVRSPGHRAAMASTSTKLLPSREKSGDEDMKKEVASPSESVSTVKSSESSSRKKEKVQEKTKDKGKEKEKEKGSKEVVKDSEKNGKTTHKEEDKSKSKTDKAKAPEENKPSRTRTKSETSSGRVATKRAEGDVRDESTKVARRRSPHRSGSPHRRHGQQRSHSRGRRSRSRSRSPHNRSRGHHHHRRSRSRSRSPIRLGERHHHRGGRSRSPVMRVAPRRTSKDRVDEFLANNDRAIRRSSPPRKPAPKGMVIPDDDGAIFREKLKLEANGKWTAELESRWKLKEEKETELKQFYQRRKKMMVDAPENDPLYAEEWPKFWEQRYTEVEGMGQDPETYDYTPEWKKYWETLSGSVLDKELNNALYEARKKVGMDLDTLKALNAVPAPPIISPMAAAYAHGIIPTGSVLAAVPGGYVPLNVPPPIIPGVGVPAVLFPDGIATGVPPPNMSTVSQPPTGAPSSNPNIPPGPRDADYTSKAMSISTASNISPYSDVNIQAKVAATAPGPKVTIDDIKSTWEKFTGQKIQQAVVEAAKSVASNSSSKSKDYDFDGHDVVEVLRIMVGLEDELSFLANSVKEYYETAERMEKEEEKKSFRMLKDKDFVNLLFQCRDKFLAMMKANVGSSEVMKKLNLTVYAMNALLESPTCQRLKPSHSSNDEIAVEPAPAPIIAPPSRVAEFGRNPSAPNSFSGSGAGAGLSPAARLMPPNKPLLPEPVAYSNPISAAMAHLPLAKKAEMSSIIAHSLIAQGKDRFSETELMTTLLQILSPVMSSSSSNVLRASPGQTAGRRLESRSTLEASFSPRSGPGSSGEVVSDANSRGFERSGGGYYGVPAYESIPTRAVSPPSDRINPPEPKPQSFALSSFLPPFRGGGGGGGGGGMNMRRDHAGNPLPVDQDQGSPLTLDDDDPSGQSSRDFYRRRELPQQEKQQDGERNILSLEDGARVGSEQQRDDAEEEDEVLIKLVDVSTLLRKKRALRYALNKLKNDEDGGAEGVNPERSERSPEPPVVVPCKWEKDEEEEEEEEEEGELDDTPTPRGRNEVDETLVIISSDSECDSSDSPEVSNEAQPGEEEEPVRRLPPGIMNLIEKDKSKKTPAAGGGGGDGKKDKGGKSKRKLDKTLASVSIATTSHPPTRSARRIRTKRYKEKQREKRVAAAVASKEERRRKRRKKSRHDDSHRSRERDDRHEDLSSRSKRRHHSVEEPQSREFEYERRRPGYEEEHERRERGERRRSEGSHKRRRPQNGSSAASSIGSETKSKRHHRSSKKHKRQRKSEEREKKDDDADPKTPGVLGVSHNFWEPNGSIVSSEERFDENSPVKKGSPAPKKRRDSKAASDHSSIRRGGKPLVDFAEEGEIISSSDSSFSDIRSGEEEPIRVHRERFSKSPLLSEVPGGS